MMIQARILLALLVVLCASVASAVDCASQSPNSITLESHSRHYYYARSPGNPGKEGYRITKGKVMWAKRWKWTQPESRWMSVQQCEAKCYEKMACRGWYHTSDKAKGGKCKLYSKVKKYEKKGCGRSCTPYAAKCTA